MPSNEEVKDFVGKILLKNLQILAVPSKQRRQTRFLELKGLQEIQVSVEIPPLRY